jgi:hypothetical protein
MRDPKRIPELLGELERVWETLPDLRFHQLIEVLSHQYFIYSKSFVDEDSRRSFLFNLEDEDFINFLKTKIKTNE